MNMDVPPLGAAGRPTTTTGTGATNGSGATFQLRSSGDIPAAPPAEVMRDVEAAARRVDWLRENGRELHFNLDSGKLRVEECDLEGRVLRTVPTSEALEIATGGPLG
jgi:hypothetical protein